MAPSYVDIVIYPSPLSPNHSGASLSPLRHSVALSWFHIPLFPLFLSCRVCWLPFIHPSRVCFSSVFGNQSGSGACSLKMVKASWRPIEFAAGVQPQARGTALDRAPTHLLFCGHDDRGLQDDTMSGPLRLNDFPSELLGKIFGHLTVPDILGLKLVGLAVSFFLGTFRTDPSSRSIALSTT